MQVSLTRLIRIRHNHEALIYVGKEKSIIGVSVNYEKAIHFFSHRCSIDCSGRLR